MFSVAAAPRQGDGPSSAPQWMRRTLASMTVLATSIAFPLVAAPAAVAGPDQDKDVYTRQHVDAPVPAWDAATRSLHILANKSQAADSVLWLGRGWRGNTAKHLFSHPGTDSRLDFLGDASRTWLSAPQDPGTGNTPIWAGIGVDGSLSSLTDDLENGNYVLDFVDVNGPGRVESFIYTPWRVNRMFSSEDITHRTVWNPRHTHAYTLFSKPGRYEVNVAAVTRSADGSTIYSSPITPVVWQVGGSDPREGQIKDYGAAYNQARAARTDGATQGGTLTIRPKTAFVTVGDDKLSDFTFTTGNPADQGRLVVLIDGFYMTEVPVTNGQASFDEMIGDDESSFQAIFIPSDPVSARIATTPVPTSRLNTTPVTSLGAATTLAEPQPHDSPELLPSSHVVESGQVSVTFTPVPGDDPDKYQITAEGDDALNAELVMSWHEKPDRNADCSYERQILAGASSGVGDIVRYCRENSKYMRVTINPHPYANVKPGNFEITDWELGEDGRTFTFELPLRDHADDLTPAERIPGWKATPYDPSTQQAPTPPATPQPKPGQPNPGQGQGSGDGAQSDHTGSGNTPTPPVPSEDTLLTDPIRIHKGHLDIRLNPAGQDTWKLAVKDDSMIGAKQSVMRAPEAVTVVVSANARLKREGDLMNPALDFLGPKGTVSYVLPDTEQPAMPWPGFSTEDVDYSRYPKGIDYKLTVRQAPADGRMLFVTSADIGATVEVHVDSNDPARDRIHTDEATHLHGTWVFSAAGHYIVDVEALSDGHTLASGRLTFDVDSLNAAADHNTPTPDNGGDTGNGSTNGPGQGSNSGNIADNGGGNGTPPRTGNESQPGPMDNASTGPDASSTDTTPPASRQPNGPSTPRGETTPNTSSADSTRPSAPDGRTSPTETQHERHGDNGQPRQPGGVRNQANLYHPDSSARRAGQAAAANLTPTSLPQRRGVLGMLGLTPAADGAQSVANIAQSGTPSAANGAQSGQAAQSEATPLSRPMTPAEIAAAQSGEHSGVATDTAGGQTQAGGHGALPSAQHMILALGALLIGAILAAAVGIHQMRKGK